MYSFQESTQAPVRVKADGEYKKKLAEVGISTSVLSVEFYSKGKVSVKLINLFLILHTDFFLCNILLK